MTLVWLTGVPGAGKSTVAAALRSHGIVSLDADADGFRAWRDPTTGEFLDPAAMPPSRDGLALDLIPDKVRALRADYEHDLVVLAGHVPNEAECITLFDQVIALVIDDDTLIDRLNHRPDRSFGKTPEVQRVILQWNSEAPAKYRRMRATTVDVTRPVNELADAVAKLCEAFDSTRR